MKRSRSSAGIKRSGRPKRKLARTQTIYNPLRSSHLNATANYISQKDVLSPEIKHSDLELIQQPIPVTWSPMKVSTSGSLITQPGHPIIGMGFSDGAKTGNKCRLISINLKMLIQLGNSGASTLDTVHLALVRKAQANRLQQTPSEIWDPAVNSGFDFFRFRNQDFVENYRVVKRWSFQFDPKFEDTGTFFNGIAPYFKWVDKTIQLSDVYENDRTDGAENGNTAATYTLWACSFNALCELRGSIRYRYQDY